MKILPGVDDSRFSADLVRVVADQFHPKDTEVGLLHVLQPGTLSEPPEMAAGYPLHTEEDSHHHSVGNLSGYAV
jgi:hypothetical protein